MGRPGIIRCHVGTLGWLGVFLVWLPLPGWAEVALATKPLIIPAPLPPNVVLTVEEAGTMRRGVPPFSPNVSLTDAKRYSYSSHYNPLYYNPKIIYKVPKKPDGTSYATSFATALRNGYDAGSGTTNLGTSYRPTYAYDPIGKTNTFGRHPVTDVGTGKPFPAVDAAVPAYYYTFDPGPGCDPVLNKETESCYSLVWVGSAEQQNFANWYSFYRTRYLATITALHLVMPKLEGKIRLAWQGTSSSSGNFCTDLSGTACKGWDGVSVDNGLKPFEGTHRSNFYAWLTRLGSNSSGSTSMRAAMKRVGDHLSDQQRYCDDPTITVSTANPARSCRDNVHIMVSDGENRDSGSVGELPAGGDVDSTAFALGESGFAITYTPQVPYWDYPLDPKPSTPNRYTLADIALYYWARDLVTGLENNILPYMPDKTGTTVAAQTWNPRNNPATWQHIVNYAVISGMSYVLSSDWKTNTYDGKQATGVKNWPYLDTSTGAISADPARIYDYWHAALNSRGQFFGVDEVDRLIEALETIAQRLEERQAAAASIATNSTRLDTGSTVYQALYHTADWHGVLTATAINTDGSLGAVQWTANIPAASERSLYTWNGSAGSLFTWAGLSGTQQAALDDAIEGTVNGVVDNAAKAQEVLSYLRGDQSKEQTFNADGVLTGGIYRSRSSLLGDIVNSDPAFVANQDLGYAVTPEGRDTATKPYKSFVAANKDRVKMLYLGANDGMLHGFIAGAGTGAAHACGGSGTEKLGQELFAYVPGALLPELPKLSDPAYVHRYYVDGSPYVGDAYLPTLSAEQPWRTILLGTTGAGGRVIFALDVTNPCEFGPGKILWERTATWDGDLGFTLSKPVIARLNNNKWAAVFGNGYNSASGHAVLFVVDLADGSLIRKFKIDDIDNNGMAAPTLYDANGDGITDYVYAGDLLGRLWKFDLSAATETDWAVAYGGAPLFTARNASDQVQPITAAVELGTPPSGTSGVMVYFGTGRFFVDGDMTDHTVQSLYGILDNGTAIAGTDRSMLQAQQILTEATDASGRTVRTVSKNPVSYAEKRGWYLDLNSGGAKGERVVSTPRRQFQRVFYTTMIPSDDPCRFGGESWVMELQPDTGGMTEASVFDLSPGADVLAGLKTTVGIIKSSEFLYQGGKGVMVDLGSTGLTESTAITPPAVATGRVSWREIID